MFTREEQEVLVRANLSLKSFIDEIFSLSFSPFIKGNYIDEVADFLDSSRWTMRVAPKDHFKSTGLYALFMREVLRHPKEDFEVHYFSYGPSLAHYHVRNIKKLISRNPYFRDLVDLKRAAESMIKYTWDNEHFITLEPHSLLGFKRGLHGHVFVDDPYQDPTNQLNPVTIMKINEIFVSQILDIPYVKNGMLAVVGTPFSLNDIFFDKNITKKFRVRIQSAIVDEKRKIALWPEHMDFEELISRREQRQKAFEREYQCKPYLETAGYISRSKLMDVVNPDLTNRDIFDKLETDNEVVGGFDIGKKQSPSHLSVFEFDKKTNMWEMIHQKFMDGWNYCGDGEFSLDHPTQIEYLKLAIKNFNMSKLHYDNTRGEFEGFKEQKILPREMVPVVFTSKGKSSMAAEADRLVSNHLVELIDDQRMINQILIVTNDLQAIETSEGHGDSFISLILAAKGMKETPQGALELSSGSPSIFK